MTAAIDLTGRVALITGGGAGIGAVCAQRLAAAGARVVVADLDENAALDTATGIGGVALPVDVGSEESIDAMVARAETEVGPIDILVNSAGIAQLSRRPEEFRQSSWDKIVAIDLRGTYIACVKVGALMARRGRGSIVNIASIGGMMNGPLHAYGPAKAGVIMLSGNLAGEWGRSGVRVNSVSPGHTLTPFLQSSFETGRRDRSPLDDFTALGRMVLPVEVANTVLFLASDLASAITGANLAVDCGANVTGGWRPYGWVPDARGQS